MGRVHSLMVAGEAAMTIALADSLFLSVSPDAARGKVILFLAVSMAPFIIVAPFVGPLIDRIRGGQRFVVIMVGLLRALVLVGMTQVLDSFTLFPLAFSALILAKTYAISKSAIIPTIINDDDEFVAANSKLGQIAGITGFVVAVPAGLLQLIDARLCLGLGAIAYLFASLNAYRLPKTVIAEKPAGQLEIEELHSPDVLRAALAMRVLRGTVGFNFFHLAFWLRNETAGTLWFGLAISLSGLATLGANFVGPYIRRRMSEKWMMVGSLCFVGIVGVIAAFSGRIVAGIALASAVNAAAAICRLAFESVVQSGAPDANRGRAFSKFETHNQIAWVIGGLSPVIFSPAGWFGFACMGIAGLGGAVLYFQKPAGVMTLRGGPAKDRGPRSRSELEDLPDL
jgi:MFS family permease